MKTRYERVLRWLTTPEHIRKFQGWSTIIWFVLAFPICIFLAESLPFVVFISVYAIVVSSFVGWQGSRQEIKDDRDLAPNRKPIRVARRFKKR